MARFRLLLHGLDAAAGLALMEEIETGEDRPAASVAAFEEGDAWTVEALGDDRETLASLARALAARYGAQDHSVTALPDRDWVAVSQARLHPVRAGRFTVHGSHDRSRIPRSRWTIEIDAAQAFGTAHHGSTKGCLLALDILAKRQRFRRVLDLGTGTGVLAVAAAKAWRARVLASDLDRVAVAVAVANAARNDVRRWITMVCADGLADPRIRRRRPYDLIVANILARPLIALAASVGRALRPGGVVVLSGITRDQSARVEAAYRAAGCARMARASLGEWVTLTLRAKGCDRQVAMPSASSRASAHGSNSARSSAVRSTLSKPARVASRSSRPPGSRRRMRRSSQAEKAAS